MGGAGKSLVMGTISQEDWPPQGLALDGVLQCGAIINFHPILTKDTPWLVPEGEVWGVFVNITFDAYFTSAIVVPCAKSCDMMDRAVTTFDLDTGQSSTRYEQIPIKFAFLPFRLTFLSITGWWVCG